MVSVEGAMAVAKMAPNDSSFPKMKTGTRLACFAVIFIVGVILSCVGSSFISKNIGAFLGLYIPGVLLAFASSVFLKGFQKQFKAMFGKTMWYVTTLFLVAVVLTIIVGACTMNTWATIIPYLISLVALIWYMLTLIPGCNACIQKLCCGCCKGSGKGGKSGGGSGLLNDM